MSKKLKAIDNYGEILEFNVINGCVNCQHENLIEIIYVPKTVTALYCQNNEITTFPNMSHLKKLYCQYNHLSELPLLGELIEFKGHGNKFGKDIDFINYKEFIKCITFDDVQILEF